MKYKYEIFITFLPDKNGKLYELQSMRIKTKLMSRTRAEELAIEEADKYWPFNEIEVTRLCVRL